MTMKDYVQATNQKLALLRTRTRIVDWHHSTANFVIQTPDSNPMHAADELSLALGTPCAVLTVENLVGCATIAKRATSPPIEPGFSWTRGIAFWANGKPCTINLPPTPHAVFFPINKHAIGAFKRDQLIDRKEAVERESHTSGWNAITADIAKVIGGTWTARAMEKIDGTIAKATKYSSHEAKSAYPMTPR